MVADAEYSRSFGYDESTKLQIGILSTNAQIKPGPFVSKLMSLALAAQSGPLPSSSSLEQQQPR